MPNFEEAVLQYIRGLPENERSSIVERINAPAAGVPAQGASPQYDGNPPGKAPGAEGREEAERRAKDGRYR